LGRSTWQERGKTALASLTKALEEFDLGKIHYGQIRDVAQIVAATASE
jgi:hypothetical protein